MGAFFAGAPASKVDTEENAFGVRTVEAGADEEAVEVRGAESGRDGMIIDGLGIRGGG
ncbi:hypothetical protein ASNO1_02270 [Corallococcus caeni]|uniref:Uncharacterized protein n=1 Tax=Corallococcus caeni TaxID=3082388 RepID=A0ABQ6QIV0_9BACT|nr:hypothetical protein ASNO1_02270 [Corallococcus sp. NO1]